MSTAARTLQPEDVVAHYRVVGPLGTGGMGEVYLAQDRTLERNVALKVLPPQFVKDEERLRRFVLEAKSASSLSHPNIVTIYEIGSDVVRTKGGAAEPDSAPVQFISMELIQGRTLTTLIHEEKTDLRTLLGYLAQAAEGLAKAHSAGIIHRDLKPGNIMVTSDGYAKVLDFGLAKLTERTETPMEMSSAPTVMEQKTGAGAVMGTTGYMSPEQVRGKPVDQRSDVFSFGCVLYEAIAGARPFVAETAVETMHKILNDQPPPVEERNKKVPAELRRIVRRCLAKNPDQRIQSMKDLAIELREVVDEWDNLALTATSVGTTGIGGVALAERSRARWIVPGALLTAVVAIAVALWATHRGSPGGAAAQAAPNVKIATLTDRGDVGEAAISNDGRYLAYLAGEVGKTSVRVRQVATGTDLAVVPFEDGIFENLSFSPDGNYLFYCKRRRDAQNYRALMQVPSLGGVSRERAFDVDSRVSFSPDGKSIVFARGEPQNSRTNLVERDLDAGTERVLTSVTNPSTVTAAPVWSPDGANIAAGVLDTSKGLFLSSLVLYDAKTGAAKTLREGKGSTIEGIAWLPDGSGLVRSGFEFANSISRQITIVDYPGGTVRRVTSDNGDYLLPTVSKGDEAIAAVRLSRTSDLSLLDPGGSEPRPLTSYRNPENSPFNFTACPDGSVMYSASRDKAVQVWSVPAGGGSPKSLSDPSALSVRPRCFAGGFVMDRFDLDGGAHVWRADPDGANGRVLTPGAAAQSVDVAANGSLVTFTPIGDGAMWVIPGAGGTARSLGDKTGLGKISPDASKILLSELTTRSDGLIERKLKYVPSGGGAGVDLRNIPVRSENLSWTPDGAAITYVDDSGPVWNLFRAPLDGGAARPVTSYKEGRITKYELSPDGRRLAVALTIGTVTNVWVSASDGSKPTQITRYPADQVFDLHWLPDGSKLVVNAGKASLDAVLIRSFR